MLRVGILLLFALARPALAGPVAANACAPEVEKQFRALRVGDTQRFAYSYGRGDRLPPFNVKIERMSLRSHVQGFSRLPGVGGENWVALTRSNLGDVSGGSGLLLAELGGVNGNGGEPFGEGMRARGGKLFYYPFRGTDHVSGFQPLGPVLAIATECSSAESCLTKPATVEFMDVSDPARAGLVNKLVIDGSLGEPGIRPRFPRAAFAAVTRLPDGRVLVFVGGSRSTTGWVYRSEGTELEPRLRWRFMHYFRMSEVAGPWEGNFQNMAFVNECGTGRVFLVGLGNRKPLKREFSLYELTDVEGFRLRHVARHTLKLGHRRSCNPDGGAGVHVTPKGRLAVYCAGKRGSLLGSTHRFSELVAP